MGQESRKEGLSFFSLDVDFFEDDKIQLIEARFDSKGSFIAIRLLCKIYREHGYYYKWGEDQSSLFTKALGKGYSPELVTEVIMALISLEFFDKEMFETYQILTSRGIQKRYNRVVSLTKVKRKKIEDRFNLDPAMLESNDNTEESAESSEEMAKSSEEIQQKKRKEIKKNETKEKGKTGNSLTKINFDLVGLGIPENYQLLVQKWIDYMFELGEPLKIPGSVMGFFNRLKDLSGLDPILADKMIDQSMAYGYKAIYELKSNNQEKGGHNGNISGAKNDKSIATGKQGMAGLK